MRRDLTGVTRIPKVDNLLSEYRVDGLQDHIEGEHPCLGHRGEEVLSRKGEQSTTDKGGIGWKRVERDALTTVSVISIAVGTTINT